MIDISSICSGDCTLAVYASSKAAVNAITKVLALELAERKPGERHHSGYFDTEGAHAFGIETR